VILNDLERRGPYFVLAYYTEFGRYGGQSR